LFLNRFHYTLGSKQFACQQPEFTSSFIKSGQLILSLSPPPLPNFPFDPNERLEKKHYASHNEESFNHPYGID
jgi:hypothetical protein